MPRVLIALACTVCGERNYRTTRFKKDGSTPLRLKKYCKHCGKHTQHEETK